MLPSIKVREGKYMNGMLCFKCRTGRFVSA